MRERSENKSNVLSFFSYQQRMCRRMSDDVVVDLEHEQEI